MAGRKVVRLKIEVPDDVDVVPMIVRKPGLSINTRPGGLKNLKLDLTTQKAGEWLNGPDGPSANACCVRGFIG